MCQDNRGRGKQEILPCLPHQMSKLFLGAVLFTLSGQQAKAEGEAQGQAQEAARAEPPKQVSDCSKSRPRKGDVGGSSRAKGQGDPQPPPRRPPNWGLLAPARRFLRWGLAARGLRGQPLAFTPSLPCNNNLKKSNRSKQKGKHIHNLKRKRERDLEASIYPFKYGFMTPLAIATANNYYLLNATMYPTLN